MTTSIGLQLNGRAYITCHAYASRTPILHISKPGSVFTLSLDGVEQPTDLDLQAIRDLVDAVLTFQSEAERLACGAPLAVAP